MNTQNTINCHSCNTPFPQGDPYEYLSGLCQPCKDKLEAEEAARKARHAAEVEEFHQRRLAEHRAKLAQKIIDATPLRFRNTRLDHPEFNATAWAKIEAHKLSEEMPWLGFVGTAGKCKTRMAYLYAINEANRLAEFSFPKIHFVSSYEITDSVTRMNGASFEQKEIEREYLDTLRKCDVLLIDDIGKGRISPAVAAELFAIVDHRYKNSDITIWTSNTTPQDIAANLPDDMSGPFAGRLVEASKIFTFK